MIVFWSLKLDALMLFMLLIIRCSEELNRTRLSLLGLLPNSCLIDQKNLTADVLPAVHIALKHLYKHRWMLKNYELQVSFHDTQVNGCRCRAMQCLSLLYEHTLECLWLNPFLANPALLKQSKCDCPAMFGLLGGCLMWCGSCSARSRNKECVNWGGWQAPTALEECLRSPRKWFPNP